MKSVYIILGVITVIGVGYLQFSRSQNALPEASDPQDAALAQVTVPPELSAEAEIGKRGFDAKCAACHGMNAAGRDGAGPPLVHVIYEPNHHGDGAFYVAAVNGVRQHHWSFGNMPAVEGVTQADIKAIISYVRELQVANGIN